MIEQQTITEYLNGPYLDYAMYVVEERAIPSVIDGFKPTQRKIMYIANKSWKTGNEKAIKVFQLGGRVSDQAMYHHGDASMNSAIIGIAQSFKNNLQLLEDKGQYGSLRSPAPGAPRYISTKLTNNFKLVYKDFDLLEKQYEEDDIEIEPKLFLPIIPMVLVNGGNGIAVGVASKILNRHPKDIINACINVLNEKRIRAISPFTIGFNGTYEKDPETVNRWIIKGKYEQVNTNTIRVTELPPDITYEKYETILNDLVEKKVIISYDDNCTGNINYVIKFKRADLSKLIESDKLEKTLKLIGYETENLTTLDENGKLKLFKSTSEMIVYFVNYRLTFYEKRKQLMLDKLERDLLITDNKAKFLKLIIKGDIKVNNIPKAKVVEQIEKHKLVKIDGSYDYLLRIPIHNLTKEKLKELLDKIKEIKNEIKKTKKLVPTEMYLEDLEDLKKTVNKMKL